MYCDGAEFARQALPYTSAGSFNPENLWDWMQAYEDKTGGEVLAIAHKGNLSNGIMFPVETNLNLSVPKTKMLYNVFQRKWVTARVCPWVETSAWHQQVWPTLNRPAHKNLMNGEMFVQLVDAWAEVRGDADIRVAIVTATGAEDFCGG